MKALVTAISLILCTTVPADENWPRFRGIDGQGKSSSTLPDKISKSNLAWSFKLSGGGSSSPVIWGNKLFIQAENKKKSINLYCINVTDGKELWSQELNTGDYHTHKFNNQAATTPSLTENEVIATWYDASKQQGMLAVFNHSGKKLWEKQVGSFKGKHGFTINTANAKDRIILSHLHQGTSYIGAFDIKTGKQLWKLDCPSEDVAYSTPLIRHINDKTTEIIVTGPSIGMMCLDFDSGKLKWQQRKAHDKRTVSSPVEIKIKGQSYITGSQKDKQYTAIKLPDTGNSGSIHWQERKIGSYVPTHLAIENRLFILQDNGALSEYDFINKKRVGQIRLSGDCYSSPILIKSKIYCITRSGVLEVIDTANGKMTKVHSLNLNPPEDTIWVDATPAVKEGRLFVRLGNRLDCYK